MLQNAHVWAWIEHMFFLYREQDPFSQETYDFLMRKFEEPWVESQLFTFEEMGC